MDRTETQSKKSWAGSVLAHGPSWLAGLALFLLMTMTFFDVVLRSAFNAPIEAATELTRFAMGIIVFASLPVVTWKGGHIAVDLLDPLFSKWAARIRDILIDLICGIVLLWPAWRVFGLAERARDFGDVTEYLNLPQFYIAYFIAISTTITALVLIARAIVRVVAPSLIPRPAGPA
ncbi:MAG: TRAP transporter small permease [Pseudomonadota bacterium]